jgi:hypothetical protein
MLSLSYGWLSYGAAVAMTCTRIPLILSVRGYSNVCALRTLFRLGHPAWAVLDSAESGSAASPPFTVAAATFRA